MAASGEVINSEINSINVLEEDLAGKYVEFTKKKKQYEAAQKYKSPFLVGSIEEVNKKVSKLDRKLQNYTALVVESRSTDKTEESTDYNYYMHMQDEQFASDYEKRLKEVQEVNQFAGIYTIKSTFLSKPSERVKTISKISKTPHKSTVKTEEYGKPKFVELHQYPGYDSKSPTPLPNGITAMDILTKVGKAQPKLKKTPLYKPEFEKLFFSQMSQTILQDVFWWIFLEKWQPREAIQQQLFNRVSHNYVELLTFASHPQYRETFLRDFPSYLAQGVYSCFCEAFTDSYRQFDHQFKENLVNLVFEWVAGARPAPHSWLKWNMDELEPANIKTRAELLKKKGNDGKSKAILDFGFLEQAPSVATGSQSTVHQLGSSVSSYTSATARKHKGKRNVTYHRSANMLKNPAKSASNDSSSTNNGGVTAIQEVAQAQHSTDSSSELKSSLRGKKCRGEDEADRKEVLTPIRETEREYDGCGSKHSKAGSRGMYKYAVPKDRFKIKESHPACKGPDFVRSVFNTNGKSPLVAHFLRMKNLEHEAGQVIRVQRTEMENLPPIDHPTYRDVLGKSFKRVREVKRDFAAYVDKEKSARSKFIRDQRNESQKYLRKEEHLLHQKREVKRLGDLIMLELGKDKDSVSAGAAQALEAALQAQPV